MGGDASHVNPFFESQRKCGLCCENAGFTAEMRDFSTTTWIDPNSFCAILRSATEPMRVEFYLNNVRQRWAWRSRDLSTLPSGTTSNEALHSRVGNLFRQVMKLSKTTMDLKLILVKFGKQLAHTTAARYPTLRQLQEPAILVLLSHSPRTNSKERNKYETFCAPKMRAWSQT